MDRDQMNDRARLAKSGAGIVNEPFLQAYTVSGEAMAPRYQAGDRVLCTQGIPAWAWPLEADCAVRLDTGEMHIARLTEGGRPGLFTLRTLNEPPIEDVRISWAAPVAFIMPAASSHGSSREIQ